MNRTTDLQPEVCIALCTYNGERFLREQLESILNQNYSNITEIVCVDDNSIDDTWLILQEYASKYNAFRIFQNKSNLGFTRNFEKAITLTSKQFIAIADQDDIWYSSKITKLVSVIGNNLMSYSDNEYIDLYGNSLGKKFSDYRNLRTCTSCLNFILYNGISGHTAMINRDLLKYALPFSNEIPFDYWLAFHATQYGVIPYVNESLVGYRQHENNALGAIGVKKNDKKKSNPREITCNRIVHLSMALNDNLHYEKKVLSKLLESYIDLSFKSRLKRVALYWKNKDALLFFKRRNEFRKAFYCLKMFWQIR
jgi:glycosyltransferase involved in cell wall biosynthesis